MKTLTYHDLSADCLNPKDANNKPILDSKGQPITFKSLDELKTYVVNLSASICQSRKSKLAEIRECQKTIQKESESLKHNIRLLQDNIPSFVGGMAKTITDEEKAVILKDCEDVLNALDDYENNISILCERFEHGKIRISSIGQARQGKSTFTQLYTGLGEDLIPTHEGDTDTTGTVCVLHHVQTNQTSYEIEYYTEQDVLNTLNYYIEQIRKAKKDKDWKLGGVSEFTSINQLKTLIGQFNVNNIDENCEGDNTVRAEIISGLKPYFQTPSGKIKWYDCLTGEHHRTDSLEEVKQHLLMYDPSLLYLATKRIDIWCKFEKNGELFQNFEVVDTKGGGTKAGLAVNKEILSTIQGSDAVFSICLLDNNQSYLIYNDLLRPNFKNNVIFKQKHFAILNPREGTDMVNGREMVSSFNICDIAYGSSLIDDNAKDFANLVIANMLLRIATLVDNFDKDRIDKCNQAQVVINERIDDLRTHITNIEPFLFDEKNAITEKVIEFVKKAREYVEKLMQDEAAHNTKKEYKDYYLERPTLYELITEGNIVLEKASQKPQIDEGSKEEDLVQSEISEAINKVYEALTPSMKVSEEHVGQYIEEKTILLDRRISRSVNRLTNQKEIGAQQRQDIFNELWKIFKLNEIFQKEQWDNSLVKSCNFFDALNEVNVPMMDGPLSNVDLVHPYNVLRNYFKNDQTIKDDDSYQIQEKFEYGKNDEIFLNHKRLQYVLTKETYKTRLHELLVKIYNQSFDVVPTLCKEVRKLLIGDVHIANECYPFYALHNEILDEIDRTKIDLSQKWADINKANISMSHVSVSSIKLN